jgi:hypothetical protein
MNFKGSEVFTLSVPVKKKSKPIKLVTINENNERINLYLYLVTGTCDEKFIKFIRVVPEKNKSKAIARAVYNENKEKIYGKELERSKLNFSVKTLYAKPGHNSVFLVPGRLNY